MKLYRDTDYQPTVAVEDGSPEALYYRIAFTQHLHAVVEGFATEGRFTQQERTVLDEALQFYRDDAFTQLYDRAGITQDELPSEADAADV